MPKHYDLTQGSDEWFSARLGLPTSSEFSNIMTPKTQKMSSSAKSYADLKIAEIMTGEMQGVIEPTYWMERGQVLEIEAREAYEFAYDVKTERGGFITTDDGFIGCSPDFLVGDDGMGEIKCLAGKNHMTYLIDQEIDPKHKAQVQGQLWVAEREYCDYWMYHPNLPPCRIRNERDDGFIKNLAACMEEFRDLMNERIENLKRRDLWCIAETIKKTDKSDDEPKYTAADYLNAG